MERALPPSSFQGPGSSPPLSLRPSETSTVTPPAGPHSAPEAPLEAQGLKGPAAAVPQGSALNLAPLVLGTCSPERAILCRPGAESTSGPGHRTPGATLPSSSPLSPANPGTRSARHGRIPWVRTNE